MPSQGVLKRIYFLIPKRADNLQNFRSYFPSLLSFLSSLSLSLFSLLLPSLSFSHSSSLSLHLFLFFSLFLLLLNYYFSFCFLFLFSLFNHSHFLFLSFLKCSIILYLHNCFSFFLTLSFPL